MVPEALNIPRKNRLGQTRRSANFAFYEKGAAQNFFGEAGVARPGQTAALLGLCNGGELCDQ